jgi:glycerophosphoryl diester phosphodiesterase
MQCIDNSYVGDRIFLLAATILAILVNYSKAMNMDIHVVPVPASSHPHIMAHRGCCANGFGGHAPENTILAFEYAHSVGAMMFETDLWFTSDRNIVIMHDNTLDRTTNCTGLISNWTLAEIQNQCEAGSWLDPKFVDTKVPSLQDLLSFVAESGMTCVLDLKERGLMQTIVRAAELTSNLDMSQLVASINYYNDTKDVVTRLKRSTILLNPSADSPIPTDIKGLSGANYFGDLREVGIDVIFPTYSMTSPSIVELGLAAARYGVQLWAFTIDAPQDLIGAAVAGVRTVCTNDPKGALSVYQATQDCMKDECKLPNFFKAESQINYMDTDSYSSAD